MTDSNATTRIVPLIPLRGLVLLPNLFFSLEFYRTKSIQALKAAASSDGLIMIAAQKDADCVEPEQSDIHSVGTLARLSMVEESDGGMRATVEGLVRARIKGYRNANYFLVAIEEIEDRQPITGEIQNSLEALKAIFEKYSSYNPKPDDALRMFDTIDDAYEMTNRIAMFSDVQPEVFQKLLDADGIPQRVQVLTAALSGHIEFFENLGTVKGEVTIQCPEADSGAPPEGFRGSGELLTLERVLVKRIPVDDGKFSLDVPDGTYLLEFREPYDGPIFGNAFPPNTTEIKVKSKHTTIVNFAFQRPDDYAALRGRPQVEKLSIVPRSRDESGL